MIDIQSIKNFFPSSMRDKPEFQQYLIKEYIQCQILEYLSNTRYVEKLSFIGGTNLRLIKHIDRFSEKSKRFDFLEYPNINKIQTYVKKLAKVLPSPAI